MTSSVPKGQTDVDDWFDIDKYKQAAGVAYEFSKKKMEDAGEQDRETIGKKGTEELAVMIDTFKPLQVTENALKIDDGKYYKSWLE